ncbi:LPS translocon maturation chaperone LptM [Halomonas sp. GXIMD04776]|uniref:LPS translocon maturation chaperone LptM n=1 Tax=Halomonas sp. GXIMD04776 TaxID=3415605 RepID=UPI003CB189D3
MRTLSSLGLVLLLLVSLAGCGQKGPLYSPGNEEAAEEYDPGDEYAEPGQEEDEREGDTSSGQGDEDEQER